jgi:hypothetical protein
VPVWLTVILAWALLWALFSLLTYVVHVVRRRNGDRSAVALRDTYLWTDHLAEARFPLLIINLVLLLSLLLGSFTLLARLFSGLLPDFLVFALRSFLASRPFGLLLGLSLAAETLRRMEATKRDDRLWLILHRFRREMEPELLEDDLFFTTD